MLSLLALIGTVLVALATTIAIVVAIVAGRPKLALGFAAAFTAWCTLYATALLGTSLVSEARVLGTNESKTYCGFYLDCHLHVAVAAVDSVPEVGEGANRRHAAGRFLVITLRVSSDARREPIAFVTPDIRIRDNARREFARDTLAERALAASALAAAPLGQMVSAGDSFLSTVVVDVPTDAHGIVLDVRDGNVYDRVLELLLIGDEDSLFHRRSVFRLTN